MSTSTYLELEIQVTGTNANTWGGIANDNFEILEKAITGVLSKSFTGSDVTLTAAENRNAIVVCSGTLTTNVNLIVKTQAKRFWVRNATSAAYTLTVKTQSGTGIAITQGYWAHVYCDGTNVVLISTTDLDDDSVVTAKILNANVTTAKIADNNVTLGKMEQMAADGFILNNTGGAADPIHGTVAQATALLAAMVADSGSGGTKGLVPAPATGDAVKALLGDADFHLAGDIDASKDMTATKGHIYLPGGFLVNWGLYSNLAYNSPQTETFDETFPTACFGIVGSLNEDHNQSLGATSSALSFYNIMVDDFTIESGVNETKDVFWIAIGN